MKTEITEGNRLCAEKSKLYAQQKALQLIEELERELQALRGKFDEYHTGQLWAVKDTIIKIKTIFEIK